MAAVIRLVAVAALASGCAQFDLSQPIQVVPDSTWSDVEVATVRAAAACWTLRFGIPFEVVREPSSAQVVFFGYNAFVCWGSWARYMPGEPAHVDICPTQDADRGSADFPDTPIVYPDGARLFTLVEHELGHAAGMLDDSPDPYAVMGGNYQPGYAYRNQEAAPAFSEVDVAALHEVAPDFDPTPACDTVGLVRDDVTGVSCTCE
jgi:hypothetical protein